MWANTHLNKQVTRRYTASACFTLAGNSNLIAMIDSGWNLDRQTSRLVCSSLPIALGARISNHGTFALALRTGLLKRKSHLLDSYLTVSSASAAGTWTRTLTGTDTVATVANLHSRHTDLGFGAVHRVFKIDIERVSQVRTLGLTTALSAGPEYIAEKVAENVTKSRS